ncbi:MAG: four helix bundle protein [Saprospiraceae bacterium]|nr:four helix bundle protein [Saprospiraceae bacterium]
MNLAIYKTTSAFPSEEKFGLISQMRRASVSIASNISEGSSYQSQPTFLRFLDVALGSLCEVESQLYLSSDVGYINEEDLNGLLSRSDELKRMILSFRKKLSSSA